MAFGHNIIHKPTIHLPQALSASTAAQPTQPIPSFPIHDLPTIKSEDYQDIKHLADGGCASIYVGYNKQSQQRVVLKKIRLSDYYDRRSKNIREEVSLCHHLCTNPHPKLIAAVSNVYKNINQSHVFIEMPFIPATDLIGVDICLTEKSAKTLAASLIRFLQFLNKHKIIYRDWKPENILINNNGFICITDFGLSAILTSNEERRNSRTGTMDSMAPEQVEKKDYNESVDTWGLGIIMYQMLSGYSPFYRDGQSDQESLYLTQKAITTDHLHPIPRNISAECHDFYQRLLQKDPKQRPSIDQLLDHKWFEGFDWDALDNQDESYRIFSQQLVEDHIQLNEDQLVGEQILDPEEIINPRPVGLYGW